MSLRLLPTSEARAGRTALLARLAACRPFGFGASSLGNLYRQVSETDARTAVRAAWERGVDVLMGDPGRRHLDVTGLRELAVYDVRTTSDLEDLGRTRAWVRAFARSEG